MKRSQVNNAIVWAKELLEDNNIRLPDMAYKTKREWENCEDDILTVKKTMLGWDITDFGTGDFDSVGAVFVYRAKRCY